MVNSREIALLILYDTEYNGAYSNLALKNAFLKHRDLSAADKSFITKIVYGTISRKLTLEYIITQNSKLKLKKLSKYILLILKMGIYQIKYMDRVPDSAAVNESVKLAKRYSHASGAGFVNGVLRGVLRNETKYPSEPTERMAYEYSFPTELIKKWCGDFGVDFTADLLEAMNTEPELSLRINTLKTTSERILKENDGFKVSPYYENAVTAKGFDVGGSKLYKDGLITAQDISAMLASLVLNPKKGDSVLDLCAAPGGKTTHMAELMENEGSIIACDIHPHKTELIEKNAERLGIDIIRTVCIDSAVYRKEFDSRFDCVLADVPCSGYGIIRRKPDIKWKNSEDTFAVSKEILTNALKYVKIGGEVVFSTCTINKEENEERFFEILNDNFEAVDISEYLPEKLRHDTAKKGYVTFYPNTDGIDGFFIAKLKRCR